MAQIFGFNITRKKKNLKSFAAPENDDGAIDVSAGGAFGHYVDMEGKIKNEIQLINRYRDMATQSECDAAIDDICNEAISTTDQADDVLLLNLNNLGAPDNIKDKIHKEFDTLIHILNFNRDAHEIFRKWYVDGRMYYHIIVDEAKKKQGIQELRQVDPRKIRKVREVQKGKAANGVETVDKVEEFYVFNDKAGNPQSEVTKGIKVRTDAVAHINSGLFDYTNNVVISHLHKAIKPLNQLRMMEDAVVIYRISRAPERRLFYIDVGNLPKAKAEEYLKDQMTRFRNKLVYDADTGEVKDDRKHMSMLEDFWLPRREGGRGTEIQTLPGGQNLGEMEDVLFFQTKLYKALNVPPSRLESDSGFSLGRESEISRDELKFSKFVDRLRNDFVELFDHLLRAQLLLKGIIKDEDWDQIKHEIQYKWAEDSYYREIKSSEMLQSRLEILRDVSDYAGRYYSMDFIRKEILQMTDEEIREMDKQIAAETEGGKLAKEATIEWGGSEVTITDKLDDEEPAEISVTDKQNEEYDGNGTAVKKLLEIREGEHKNGNRRSNR
jgi:hypothetical protein